MHYRRGWLVDDLVPGLQYPLGPIEVLAERDRPERMLPPYRAPHAGTDVVEGYGLQSLHRREGFVALQALYRLHVTLGPVREVVLQAVAREGIAVGARDLAAVDPGHRLVPFHVLDQLLQPPFVGRD